MRIEFGRLNVGLFLYTKNHIFFFQMFWKDGLPKKITLECDLSCIMKKDISPFPENMILYFRRKMKADLSQKNT